MAKQKSQSKVSTDTIDLSLGKNIAARRKKLTLTQDQVAERLGVEPMTISRFECGVSLPSLRRLVRLSAVLETSAAELLAQSVGNRSDQSLLIEQWLQPLSARQRSFVVDSVRQLCEYFAAAE